MLDQEMIEQLREVFAPLESDLQLSYFNSPHADQSELLELIQGLSKASSKIHFESNGKESPFPRFNLLNLTDPNKPCGIGFSGIPTGHEFTSLILALLHADQKGKWPDNSIQQRIRNIKGPIRLRTYISLTCENCPDVVQALNQMSLIHPDFSHEMVDGSYVQNEIQQYGIQGVPSVMVDGTLIHSGRADLLTLIQKLEDHFSLQEKAPLNASPTNLGHYDVLIIGGGPAGASAAIYSARKGLRTALLSERMGGQVQETKGIENLISVPYTEGPELAQKLETHMKAYAIDIFEHRRVQKIEDGQPKVIQLEGGESIKANQIIIATGAKWRELGIPGEKDFLGRGVAYCPHCDGPYYKGKRVAVIGGGNSGVEAAIDLAGIVGHVTLFEYQNELKADHVLVQKLRSLPNVSIITSAKTQAIKGAEGKVTHLQYEERLTQETKDLALDGVFVQIGLLPNSLFVKDLLQLSPSGEIIVDTKGRTSVRGIYAAGDVTTTPYKQIIIAMGEGAKAALAAFEDQMMVER